jgi:hypothetical protein
MVRVISIYIQFDYNYITAYGVYCGWSRCRSIGSIRVLGLSD